MPCNLVQWLGNKAIDTTCVTAVSESLVDVSWQAWQLGLPHLQVLITHSMQNLEHRIRQCDV